MGILRQIGRWAAMSWLAIVGLFFTQIAFAFANHPIGVFGTRGNGCTFEKFEYQCRGFQGAEAAQFTLSLPTVVAVGGPAFLLAMATRPLRTVDIIRRGDQEAMPGYLFPLGVAVWALVAVAYLALFAFKKGYRRLRGTTTADRETPGGRKATT